MLDGCGEGVERHLNKHQCPLQLEMLAEDKLEYRNGNILTMPGALPSHSLIAGWIITYLNILLMILLKIRLNLWILLNLTFLKPLNNP